LNQFSILYDLYERIKEAQQGDDGVRRILGKVQSEKFKALHVIKEC